LLYCCSICCYITVVSLDTGTGVSYNIVVVVKVIFLVVTNVVIVDSLVVIGSGVSFNIVVVVEDLGPTVVVGLRDSCRADVVEVFMRIGVSYVIIVVVVLGSLVVKESGD